MVFSPGRGGVEVGADVNVSFWGYFCDFFPFSVFGKLCFFSVYVSLSSVAVNEVAKK